MDRRAAAPLARPVAAAVGAGLVSALVVLVAWLGWRSRAWPLIHDAPLMHYVAWRIAGGAVPYRDLFDMNFPGVYLIHLAVVTGLGTADVAWRAFDLAWLAVGALLVAALARPWGPVAAAGGALLFAAHHLAGGPWHAGQRDFLLAPFLLAAALGVAGGVERRSATPLMAAGLALGAGITIKPHAALYALLLGVLIAAGRVRAVAPAAGRHAGRPGRSSPLAVVHALGAYAAGLGIAPVLVLAWLAATGALEAWREIVLEYLLPLYSRLGRPATLGFHRWHVWIPLVAAVVLSLGAAAAARRLGSRHWVAALGLAYGIAHYVGQGKGWEYHVYPFAAFASALAFCEIGGLLRARRWLAATPIAASLVIAVVLMAAKGAEASDAGWIRAKERRVEAVVTALAARLRPGERVQVLDTTEGGIHALLRLGVAQPTRFLYDFHFFHDVEAPVIRRLRAQLIGALDADPPRFIVVFDGGWPAGGPERLAGFPELAGRLARDYRPAAAGDGWVLHAKRDGP